MTAAFQTTESAQRVQLLKSQLEQTTEALAGGRQLVERMSESRIAAREAVDAVGRNSSRIGTLGMHAAIESAHLNDVGGNFRIVASRMRDLSASARDALAGVGRIFAQMGTCLAAVETSIASSQAITSRTLAEVQELSIGGQLSHDRAASLSEALASMASAVSLGDGVRTSTGEMDESSLRAETILFKLIEVAEDAELLALNATIGAARAGERGRAFAVIAVEIGRLARTVRSDTLEVAEAVGAIRRRAGRLSANARAEAENMHTLYDMTVTLRDELVAQETLSFAGAVVR
ncbi:MAG TPA: methyl-accepting chemotaxis protein [Candidatus Cybelea sp.]|nr:methyl-accepting chemotaxis protein [Candidatus Cybelea sp.]